MKESFSKVMTLNVSTEKVFSAVKDPVALGKFVKNVPSNVLNDVVKDGITYNSKGVYLDVAGFSGKIELSEVTDRHVKFNVDFTGLKDDGGVVFVQILPNGDGSKIRLAAGYDFSYSPAGLLLRAKVNDEDVSSFLTDVVEALVEGLNEKED